MRLEGWRSTCLVLSLVATSTGRPQQQALVDQEKSITGAKEWDLYGRPHPDATSHLIFDNVNSLMQHWPNAYYQNGHTIVPATITPGTLLYHGRWDDQPPTLPDWFSFDAEHSLLFSQGTKKSHLFIYAAVRELKVLYLDGSSAAKMTGGALDSQTVITRGNFTEDSVYDERGKIMNLCAWGKEFGLDGFIRMEFDFEVMYCDFTNGVKLVSSLELVKWENMELPQPPEQTQRSSVTDALMGHSFPAHRVDEPRPTSGPPRSPKGPSLPRPTGLPFPPRPPELPAGWKGSLRTHLSLMFESVQVGNWHNFHPVPGVRIDHSKLITFYDPRYSSLVKARHGQHRFEHRLWNISKDDLELAHNDLRQVLTRDEKGSGVNWGDVTRNVVERYSERLDFLKKIVKSEFTPGNVTEAVVLGRQQVLMMLSPYLLQNAAVPPPTDEDLGGFGRNASWIQPSLEHCSTVFTSHIADAMLTDQERLIKNAVEDTAREICRVLGIVWVSAYDAEDKSVEEQAILLKEWTKEVDELMDWLGWSIWVTCSPACGADEMCSLPQWPFDMKTGEERDRQKDHQPHCLSRFHWMPFKHL